MAEEQKPKAPKEPKAAKEPKERKKKSAESETKDGILVATSKAVGAAVGKIASAAVVAEPALKPHTLSSKVPKLQKKNKSRLPRRQKKALQKAAPTQVQR